MMIEATRYARRALRTKFSRSIATAAVAIAAAGCATGDNNRAVTSVPDPEEPETVELARLLAEPGAWDGKYVRVGGVVRFEFEANALYVDQPAHDDRDLSRSVWLGVNLEMLEPSPIQLNALNGRGVLIDGTFDADDQGHAGLYPAALNDTTRIVERRDR